MLITLVLLELHALSLLIIIIPSYFVTMLFLESILKSFNIYLIVSAEYSHLVYIDVIMIIR